MKGEGKSLTSDENVAYLAALVNDYPIISSKTACAEDDWDGWKALTDTLGGRIQLGGRRSVCNQPERLAGHRARSANSHAGKSQSNRHVDRNT